MSQKLPVNNFEWMKDTSQFDEGYFLEVDVEYLEQLHELHNDLAYLSEIMKIEKAKELVANLYDKTEYLRNLKQALNNELVFKKVHKVIKCN